jgi:hypothetical protein
MQIIQSPEPFTWSNVQITVPTPTAGKTTPTATFTTPGTPPANPPFNLTTAPAIIVQAGDFLEITYGLGSIHRIVQPIGSYSVSLASTPPAAVINQLQTTNWRVIRQPQPLMGEPALELPNTVVVYPNTTMNFDSTSSTPPPPGSLNLPPSLTSPGNVDIVFAPSGQVINATGGQIVLWVWDTNQVSQPTLLTIYPNTGFVAAHPVAPGNNPFAFTQDGQSSGY